MIFFKKIYLNIWMKRDRIIRFILSGGTAAFVNLFLLYLLTEWVGLYYLTSVVISFLAAVCVSFILQKFWTFSDVLDPSSNIQISVFFLVSVINACINTWLVYNFVEHLNIYYLIAQFISSGIIAIESYFIYKNYVFKKLIK